MCAPHTFRIPQIPTPPQVLRSMHELLAAVVSGWRQRRLRKQTGLAISQSAVRGLTVRAEGELCLLSVTNVVLKRRERLQDSVGGGVGSRMLCCRGSSTSTRWGRHQLFWGHNAPFSGSVSSQIIHPLSPTDCYPLHILKSSQIAYPPPIM